MLMSEHNESSSKKTTNARPQSAGFGGQSVAVFGLGLSGALVWGLGIIPSIMALVKAKKAKSEITSSKGNLKGFGLIKWGIALAITGIINFLASIALVFGAIWVVNQIPVWVEDAITDGSIGGIEVVDVLPPVNLEELGLPEESLKTIEGYLPEGQTLESVSLRDLLDIAEQEGVNLDGYIEELDPDGTLSPSQTDKMMQELEKQGYLSSDIESLLPEGQTLETVELGTLLEVVTNQSGSLNGLSLNDLEEMGLDGFGLEALLSPSS